QLAQLHTQPRQQRRRAISLLLNIGIWVLVAAVVIFAIVVGLSGGDGPEGGAGSGPSG
ncbi:MAG: hypothetical protein H7287_01620, partial [Thermoleophilia bacterium]|nr:hypothetical protein [Thermoleophilia bacterium]